MACIPNVYGIDTPEGVVIIDTGLNQEDMQCVDKRLQQWGLASKPISGSFNNTCAF